MITKKLRYLAYTYEPGSEKYFLAKTFDDDIREDDFIVVPSMSRFGMCIAQVYQIDLTSDEVYADRMKRAGFNPRSNTFFNDAYSNTGCWCYGVFDRDKFDQAQEHELRVIKNLSK